MRDVKAGVSLFTAVNKVTPIAPPTGCGIWPVPNRNLLIFVGLPIPCIIVNANGRSKRGRPGTEASILDGQKKIIKLIDKFGTTK